MLILGTKEKFLKKTEKKLLNHPLPQINYY